MTSATGADRLVQMTLLGEAIEFLPVAVFVFDEHGRYVAVNDHAAGMLGYPREELLKMRLGELAESPEAARATYEAVATGKVSGGVIRARRRDGSVVELSFRGGPTTIAGMPFYVGVAWEAAGTASPGSLDSGA